MDTTTNRTGLAEILVLSAKNRRISARTSEKRRRQRSSSVRVAGTSPRTPMHRPERLREHRLLYRIRRGFYLVRRRAVEPVQPDREGHRASWRIPEHRPGYLGARTVHRRQPSRPVQRLQCGRAADRRLPGSARLCGNRARTIRALLSGGHHRQAGRPLSEMPSCTPTTLPSCSARERRGRVVRAEPDPGLRDGLSRRLRCSASSVIEAE